VSLYTTQHTHCTYKVTLWLIRLTTGAVEKAIFIPYSECVCR